jgi:exosome complex exonuclease RRP6
MDTPERSLSKGSFDQFNSETQAAALMVTKQTLAIPQDVAFHRSMDSDLAQRFDAFSSRVLDVMNRLLVLASTIDSSEPRRNRSKAKLENQDDVMDNFHSVVVDCMEGLLERTVSRCHICLPRR